MFKSSMKTLLLAGLAVSSSVKADEQSVVDLCKNVKYTAEAAENWAGNLLDRDYKRSLQAMISDFAQIINPAVGYLQTEKNKLQDSPIEQELVSLVEDFYKNLQEIYDIFNAQSNSLILLGRLKTHGDIDYTVRIFEENLVQLCNKSKNDPSFSEKITQTLDELAKTLVALREKWEKEHSDLVGFKLANVFIKVINERKKQ